MPASSFYASRPRDSTRRMSATELICATPSQQRLRLNSVAAALQPSTQLLSRPSSRCCCSTSRRDAAAPRGRTRAARSISSVAAALSLLQQQRQATAASRDHWAAPRMGSPSTDLPLFCHRDILTYIQRVFVHNLSSERALRSLP